jgi:hypothetical protein
MDTGMIAMRKLTLIFLLLSVAACSGLEKGSEAGIGFDAMNTISKEEKENDAWFGSFYGKNHCHGQWASDCKPESDVGGGGGGGMWGGGVGPSDSVVGHSDSGSSN